MYTGSPFFDSFWLKKIVEEKYPWATKVPKSSGGIPGGMMGGANEAVRPSWDRFQEYAWIFFLNKTALRMYRDAGTELEILDKISADEMPDRCYRPLRGPYVPRG